MGDQSRWVSRVLAPGVVLGLALGGCGDDFKASSTQAGAAGTAGAGDDSGSAGGRRASGGTGGASAHEESGGAGGGAGGASNQDGPGAGTAEAGGGAAGSPDTGSTAGGPDEGGSAGAAAAGAPPGGNGGASGVGADQGENGGATAGSAGHPDSGGGSETGGTSACAPGSAECLLDLGAECTSNAACASHFCVDGVCCESVCGETCLSCAAPGSLGSCVAVDEDEACGDVSCPGSTECRSYVRTDSGNCMDIGECREAAECVVQNASSAVSCADGAGTCDGLGACEVPDKVSLGYACAVDEDCAEGACVESTSGDLICCDLACDGACEACGGDGRCDEVPADDDQCGTITCDAGDACTSYPAPLTANRCQGLSQCVTEQSHCQASYSAAGESCGSSMECDGAGDCALICPAGQVACDASCIDPLTDVDHCGAAGDCSGTLGGDSCSSTEECSAGVCVPACASTEVRCDGTCIDPATSHDYCGALGACTGASSGEACRDTEICVDGTCEIECYGGNVVCGGACINPRSSEGYCGAAGTCDAASNGDSCSSSATCVMGACATWGRVEAISLNTDTETGAREPQVGVADSGDALVVWAEDVYDTGDHIQTIRARSFDQSTSTWGSEVALNGDVTDDAYNPKLAMNGSGVAWAVWREYDGSQDNVWGRRFSGGSWDASAVQLSTGGYSYAAQVAVASNGDAVAVWQHTPSAETDEPYQLWARTYTGGSWGAATRISRTLGTTSSADQPQVIMPVSGNPLVTWLQCSSTTNECGIYSSFLTGSAWQDTPVLAAANVGNIARLSMGSDSTGGGRLAYVVYRGTGKQVFTRSFNATDHTWSADETQIGGSTSTYPDDPMIATDGVGNSVAVWRDSGSTPNLVASSLVVASGAWTSEVRIEDDAGQVFPASIASSPDGMVIVAWPQQNASSTYNIAVNTFNAFGGTWESHRIIQTDTTVGAFEPSTAFSRSGKAVVAWAQNGVTSAEADRIWVAQLE